MKKRKIYQISILLTTAIFALGCYGTKTVKPIKQSVVSEKPQSMAVQPSPQSFGMKLKDLKSAGVVTRLTLRGNPTYSVNEPIQFIVDTGKQEGYLYIIALDNNGGTGLLYPNPKSPSSEMGGRFLFPQDFGNMIIRASKDCGGCAEERTTVYALLSKEPISDIKNITQAQLMSLMPKSQGKGISMDLDAGTASNANLNIGQLQFIVK